jgi:hypothetical protein
MNFGELAGNVIKGVVGGITGISGIGQAVGGALGAVTGAYNTYQGNRPLNQYATEVDEDYKMSQQGLAQNTKGFTKELSERAINPMNSQLGQSLLAQHQSNVNRNLASSLISGQANSYDIAALQQRATDQGISAITGQLSGLAGQASQQYISAKNLYSGMSPARSQVLPQMPNTAYTSQ